MPIIYNNIGSYKERLKNNNNCFSFEEDNYYEIKTILNNIENKEDTNEKDFSLEYPSIYNNLPDFLYFSNIEYEFKINEIEKNLINKCVCFIHFCNIDNSLDILNDQINYIKKSNLYEKLDYIFINLLGEYVKIDFDNKIKLIYYSEDCNEMEFPTFKNMKYFVDNIDFNVKILYIHTKGVLKKYGSYEWRKYLEYFLIENNKLFLDLLNKYYCVGVNQQFYFDSENKYRNHFSGNFWWSNSNYMKLLPVLEVSSDRYVVEHWLIGNLEKNDYRYFLSLNHTDYDLYKNIILKEQYNLQIIKNETCKNLLNICENKKIYGLYFICCIGNYLEIIKEQIDLLIESKLYLYSTEIICFICNETDECLNLLNKFNKIKIISTNENLYEKFAINNFKKYVNGDYYLYYFHTKSISRNEKCYLDWTKLCNYFTIKKWQISLELLNYYDCVGTNLKNFPKKHFSGNFWWSKSEHLNKLNDINNGYLSSEMYILSYMKTNYVSIYQSYVNHGDTEYSEEIYNNLSDSDLINNICIIPDFNEGDKNCIDMCGEINPNFEPPIFIHN